MECGVCSRDGGVFEVRCCGETVVLTPIVAMND